MRMSINGVPVILSCVGDRWEARVGHFGLLTVSGHTAVEVMRQVTQFCEPPTCHGVAA